MSLKLFKNLVTQIKEIISYDFGVIDDTGSILACSDRDREGEIYPQWQALFCAREDHFNYNGSSYKKVYIRNKLEFIAFINSEDEKNRQYLSLIAINIRDMKINYDEKYDRNNLIKNILMDNILPGDITLRAKELHLEYNADRVIFLINTEKNRDQYPSEVIQNLFPNKMRDFLVVIDDENIVLVKQLKNGDNIQEIEKTANIILDTLNTELMVKAMISIGTIAQNIRDIGRSYKEAQTAMLVGGIFESDKSIVNYNSLGLGRLIYQLPTALCRIFLREVFKEGSFEALDSETILTIQKFFENNLNVSETARQLYVHRNTLVYRLDKIKKLTGLDLREFDDAIVFKVSMLVKRYLDKNNELYNNGY